MQWLHREKSGRLILDDRPFVYYDVKPTKKPEGKVYTASSPSISSDEPLFSGTINIYFSAHDPFGKMLYKSYRDIDIDIASRHCGIMEESRMPKAIEASVGDYLVYNPGTETATTTIRIAGTAKSGITITNRTTGDICKLLAIPTAPDYLEIDSEYGTVKLHSDPDGFAYEYHDDGYISLAPCIPYDRDVTASYTEGSNVVSLYGICMTEEDIGRYIRLAGEWVRIIYVNDTTEVVVSKFMGVTATENTMIAAMNEISIEGEDSDLTKLEFDYTPKIR